MKKVLFLSYYFPPHPAVGGKRIANLVAAVRKTGNEARVLTIDFDGACPPSYIETLSLELDRRQAWQKHYRLARQNHKYLSAFFARLIYALHSVMGYRQIENSFFSTARKIIIRHGIDFIVTSGPPFLLHKVGVRLRKKLPVKWIADFRDPWLFPEGVYNNRAGMTDREKVHFYNTLKFADHITATTKSHTSFLQSQYGSAPVNNTAADNSQSKVSQQQDEKVYHIQNGVDLSLFDTAVTSQYQFRKGINVGYLGDLDYTYRDPRNIIRAVKNLNDVLSTKIHLHFWCDLTNEPTWAGRSLPQFVGDLGLEKYVHINPYVSFEKSLDIQLNLDALVIIAFDQHFQIPAKTYEYLLSNTPILGLCEGESETYRLLAAHGGVALVDENSTVKIESGLHEIIARSEKKVQRKRRQLLSPEQDMVMLFNKLLN